MGCIQYLVANLSVMLLAGGSSPVYTYMRSKPSYDNADC
jgi:hypothetical protein